MAIKRVLFISFFVVCFSCKEEKQPETKLEKVDSISTEVIKSVPIKTYDIINWLNKTPAEVGCIFENEFGYTDSIFNCSVKKYVNQGDPCENYEAYYEGPQLPNSKASKVHPSVESIHLAFEHGNLQAISLLFKTRIPSDSVIKIFKLPAEGNYPSNLIKIEMNTENSAAETDKLNLLSFEHMGEGDVDCP